MKRKVKTGIVKEKANAIMTMKMIHADLVNVSANEPKAKVEAHVVTMEIPDVLRIVQRKNDVKMLMMKIIRADLENVNVGEAKVTVEARVVTMEIRNREDLKIVIENDDAMMTEMIHAGLESVSVTVAAEVVVRIQRADVRNPEIVGNMTEKLRMDTKNEETIE